jgi:voltage-gated potassium channel
LYEVLEEEDIRDLPSQILNISILVLIFLNVIAVMIGTVPRIEARWSRELEDFEAFSVAVFTVEYILRLWVCTLRPGHERAFRGRVKYALRWMPLVDLAAILPFYLSVFGSFDLRFVRALRLMRLLRLFKVGRYSVALSLIGQVFRSKKGELAVAVFVASILFCIISALMYQLENSVQPAAFSSVFSAMWWTVSALTPLSSELSPMTQGGRILAGVAAFLGVAMFALPAGILASGFSRALADKGERRTKECPHCGAQLSPGEPPGVV